MKKKLLSLLSVSTVLVPFVAVSCGTTQEPKPVDPTATEVNVFKQTHATVLAKTESNVTAGDEASVNRALGDYNSLSAGAKGQLTTQKSNLDKLSAKITQLKAGQTKDKVGTGDPAPGAAPKPERPGETTGNQAVAALKTEIRTLLSELPSRNPRKLEVELGLNSNNDQTNLQNIKSELETLKNALNTAYAKLKTALETKLPTGNKFKTRVLNYVTTRSSDADEITELTNFETQLTQEETRLKEGIETLKSELGYFSSNSQFRKEKEAEFAKALNEQTYFTDISQYSEKETEIRAKYVEENKSKVQEYFGEAPDDAKYQKNNLVNENDQMSAVKQWFVMGQKGGNLFRYLPGEFPPNTTKWLTTDETQPKEATRTTNADWKVNSNWSESGNQKGKIRKQTLKLTSGYTLLRVIAKKKAKATTT